MALSEIGGRPREALVALRGVEHSPLGPWISQLPSRLPRLLGAVSPLQGFIEN